MATTPRRGLPFVWITWVSKPAAGLLQCLYPSWLRAHFKGVEEYPGDFDLDAWKAEHDQRVKVRLAEFETDGCKVRVESQNWLRVKGERALLIGKPDLVAERGGQFTIADSKKKQSPDDLFQMLGYLYMLPRAWGNPHLRVTGELFYEDGTRIDVHPQEFDSVRRKAFFDVVLACAEKLPPQKVPSFPECSRCHIVACDARMAAFGADPEDDLPVTAEEF